MNNRPNIKFKYVTFLECWVLEYERLYLSLGCQNIKVKRLPKFQ